MVKLLDPDGSLITGQVLSQENASDFGKVPSQELRKSLLRLGLPPTRTLILDDMGSKVWDRDAQNVLTPQPYQFIHCLRRSPTADELAAHGLLFSILAVLKDIHAEYSAHPRPERADVRHMLGARKRKVFAGLRFLFSRVIPRDERHPHTHPLWKLSEEFGATCTTMMEDAVTHVIAVGADKTDKMVWGEREGKCVVHPNWVHACAHQYRRVALEGGACDGDLLAVDAAYERHIRIQREQLQNRNSAGKVAKELKDARDTHEMEMGRQKGREALIAKEAWELKAKNAQLERRVKKAEEDKAKEIASIEKHVADQTSLDLYKKMNQKKDEWEEERAGLDKKLKELQTELAKGRDAEARAMMESQRELEDAKRCAQEWEEAHTRLQIEKEA